MSKGSPWELPQRVLDLIEQNGWYVGPNNSTDAAEKPWLATNGYWRLHFRKPRAAAEWATKMQQWEKGAR